MASIQQIHDLIRSHGGFISTKDISSSSVYHRLLDKVKEGSVIRVSTGVYALNESLANTMVDITKVVPDGVLCQYSAWEHYGLTTQIPPAICVAVKRGRKVNLPQWPPLNLYHINSEIFELGATTENVGGFNLPIYDIERSVCDAVKARNKIGIDVSSEILKNYLSRKDCNITKLMRYAKILRVATTISKYLEIQLV